RRSRLRGNIEHRRSTYCRRSDCRRDDAWFWCTARRHSYIAARLKKYRHETAAGSNRHITRKKYESTGAGVGAEGGADDNCACVREVSSRGTVLYGERAGGGVNVHIAASVANYRGDVNG